MRFYSSISLFPDMPPYSQLIDTIVYKDTQLRSGVHDGSSFLGGMNYGNYYSGVTNPFEFVSESSL